MATNLHIDEELLEKAVKVGNHKTKREAVNKALADYVRQSEQLRLFREIAGTIDIDPDYDYKPGRRKR
jgi:Arc/MetJ family transcription regulator